MNVTIWLLVFVVKTNGGGITSQTIEFWDDKKACEEARTLVTRTFASKSPENTGSQVSSICIPRPEGP